MSNKRHSPRAFRSKGVAVTCFIICVAVIAGLAYYGLQFVRSYDFTDSIPEDAKLRAKFSSAGYIPPEPTAKPTVQPSAAALPTPNPTPMCTPLPLEMYSMQKMSLVMPAEANAAGEADVQYLNVISGDGDQTILLGGWAYIYGFDAEASKIYLVVSSSSGSVNRFYETTKQPGFAGIVHTGSGSNLDRADFRAAFSVKTYEEGAYRLGALVEQPGLYKSAPKTYGYYDFGTEYQFYVKGKKVTQVG